MDPVPFWKVNKVELRAVIGTFSVRAIFGMVALCVASIIGFLFTIHAVNSLFLVEAPAYGGSMREGIIGSPRFVNPVLSVSESDEDLARLIYTGLMRKNGDGTILPDLAERYNVSENGLEYTFTLRDSAVFHDGTPVTSEDVSYTVLMTQDQAVKSPRKINWEGVKIEAISEKTIRFTLKQPYPPFLEENARLGILPKHLWKDLSAEEFALSDYNIEPIGAGPYRLERVLKTHGIPSEYNLVSFENYARGRPFIDHVTLFVYPNERELLTAFDRGEITNISAITPDRASEFHDSSAVEIKTAPLPRVFAIFLNQNEAQIFLSKKLRQAIDKVIDKKKIVSEVLHGFGTPLEGPIPPSNPFYEKQDMERLSEEEILALFAGEGWKKNEVTGLLTKEERRGKTLASSTLSFSITTGDIPELTKAANLVRDMLSRVGISAEVKIFSESDLRQNAIKPRKYDALLYGNQVEHDSELYAYWHSSERLSPGLNFAVYTNTKVDRALEEMRISYDPDKRKESYMLLEREIREDAPAIFLYSPNFIYIVKSGIEGIGLGGLQKPADRFANIYEWYIEKQYVWPIFKDIPIIKKIEEVIN